MPRRWLSTRGRKEEQKDICFTQNPQNEFDFEFTEPGVLVECSEVRNVEVLRPTTSTEDRDRSKRKPDLTLLIERPRSSDSALPKTPSSARFDTSKIGLAFGSPRHPPQGFASMTAIMGPQLRNLTHCDDDNDLVPATKAKKWKLSPFFKQRQDVQRNVPCSLRVNSPDINKLGLPIQRTPWRNPKSPPVAQAHFTDVPPPPPEKDERYQKTRARATVRSDGVPAVEINIPETPLDRISIMFKDVDGFGPPRLLTRRSRELDSLMLANTDIESTGDLRLPQIQRRVTSPTIRSKTELQPSPASSSNMQKYSLFPATPTNTRFPTHGASPQSHRNRTLALPASSAAGSSGKNKAGQAAAATNNSESLTAKESDSKLNLPSTIISGSDSRISSTSEIFFGIKSFRDSSGQIGNQFEMTRAPSEAVQLMRSKSKKRQEENSEDDGDQGLTHPRVTVFASDQSTADQIDETIEIVERMTSPSSTPPSRTQSKDPPRSMQVAETNSSVKKFSRKGPLRSGVRSLSLGVPSPVPEAVEEEVLSSNGILRSDCYPAKEVHDPQSTPPRGSTSSKVPGSPPRAAIIKEVHNIPLSKYAPKYITEDLVKQTGLRPVRPGRANTDNSISYNPGPPSSHRPGGPSRSSTIPAPSQPPRSKYADPTPTTIPDPSQSHWQDVPVKITYVAPTAEVSIARTVSLSRTPSTKVTLSRHPSRLDSKPAPEQVTEKTVPLGMAVVQEVHKKHKYGQSIGIILETASIAPSSPPPPIPSPQIFDPHGSSVGNSQAVAV